MNGVEVFVAELSGVFGVETPRVVFDAPISSEAQYSPATKQIQFSDEQAFIRTLVEQGSVAPLRWTLHEFAHHLQQSYGVPYSEETARWFTDTLVEEVMDEWRTAVVQDKQPTIQLNTQTYEERLKR